MGAGRWIGLACAVALGVFAFVETQVLLAGDPAMKKAQQLCVLGNRTKVTEAGLHDYEPCLGGPIICFLTQFVLGLAQDPAGILVWGLLAVLFFPLILLVYAEAGRWGASGPMRWPILTFLLGQLLGLSVVFPILWVPSAVLGQGSGTASKERVIMCMLIALAVALAEVGVFTTDTHTRAWTLYGDLLVGPLLPFAGVLLWPFPARSVERLATAASEVRSLRNAYACFSLPALGGYLFLVWYAYNTYDTWGDFLAALWGPAANTSVAFMTIDSGVMCLALFLYLALTGPVLEVVLALFVSPLVGPGAAVCVVLARREERRGEDLSGTVREALLQ